jgi:hypothetical protein
MPGSKVLMSFLTTLALAAAPLYSNCAMCAWADGNIDARLSRQYNKIDTAVQTGQISSEQAARLRMAVTNIENRVKLNRQENGGQLSPDQHISTESQLNQSLNQIEAAIGAGASSKGGIVPISGSSRIDPPRNPKAPSSACGVQTSSGQDGALDSLALLKKMKAKERRALREQRQAAAQSIEQQQLQYDKEMADTLSKQRAEIEQQKQQLPQK